MTRGLFDSPQGAPRLIPIRSKITTEPHNAEDEAYSFVGKRYTRGKRKGSPAGAEREAKTARLGDITTGDLEQQFQLYNDRAMAAQNKRLESLKQDVIAKVGESGRTLCEEVVDVQKGLAAMHTALDDLKQSQATAHTHVLHAIDSSRNDQKAFTEKLHRDIGSR